MKTSLIKLLTAAVMQLQMFVRFVKSAIIDSANDAFLIRGMRVSSLLSSLYSITPSSKFNHIFYGKNSMD